MTRKRVLLFAVCLAILTFVPAAADDGTSPVFFPGFFIGASGSYTVTSNLIGGAAGCAGPVVTISAPDVELDLNGFNLDNSACATPVIVVLAPSDHVKIHNGTLIGGGSAGIDVPGGMHRKVDLEDLKIHDTGGPAIHFFDVAAAAVRRVEIADAGGPGIVWDGGVFNKTGTIENNIIRTSANGIIVTAGGSAGLAIQNNRIEDLIAPGFGIVLDSSAGDLIAENTISDVPGQGIFLFVPGPGPPGSPCRSQGNKLFDNVVNRTGSHGINIGTGSCDNLLLNNVVTNAGGGAPGVFASGLLISGSRNFLHGNLSNFNNTFGLHFWDSAGPGQACGNGFGRNLARGNLGFVPPAPCGAGPALFPPQSCNTAAACPAAPLGANATALNNLIPGLF